MERFRQLCRILALALVALVPMQAIAAPAMELLCSSDIAMHDHGTPDAHDDEHDHPAGTTHDCCHAFLAVPFSVGGIPAERPLIDVPALVAARALHLTGALDRPPHPRSV